MGYLSYGSLSFFHASPNLYDLVYIYTYFFFVNDIHMVGINILTCFRNRTASWAKIMPVKYTHKTSNNLRHTADIGTIRSAAILKCKGRFSARIIVQCLPQLNRFGGAGQKISPLNLKCLRYLRCEVGCYPCKKYPFPCGCGCCPF